MIRAAKLALRFWMQYKAQTTDVAKLRRGFVTQQCAKIRKWQRREESFRGSTDKELDILKATVLTCILSWMLCASLAQAQKIYICTDGNGRRLTSDRPIAECVDRVQRVIDGTGTVRRIVGPTLTENEQAALEAARQEELKEKNRIEEARRRARALLARYPSEIRHQQGRKEALSEMNADIDAASKRLATLKEEHKNIEAELESWREDIEKAPENLQRKHADSQLLIDDQLRLIALREKEKARINEQFDGELVYLRELWAELAERKKKMVEESKNGAVATRPASP